MSLTCKNHFLNVSSPFIHQPIKFSKPFINKPFKFFTTPIQCNQTNTNSNNNIKKPPMNKKNTNPKRRSGYGTSRRSILKKSFTQEQVVFSTPLSDDPVVGIIGGGMAGLVCALYLDKRGIKSTVFDTGIHGLGGRLGTRIIDPQPLTFDHAAQFFTISDPKFGELVNIWLEKGLVREWQGTVGELEQGGQFVPFSTTPPKYIGVNGMKSLADSILSETSKVNVIRPCWVSNLEPYNGMWHLSEKGKPCGQFDAVVIAHNGKCANRLLAASGLPLVAKQMKTLGLSSIWALLAAFEDPLPLPANGVSFEGAFIKGSDSVSWMANNTKKLFGSSTNTPHCWTIFSTESFGKQYKVPQESIPNITAEKVKEAMLNGVEDALGISIGSLKPFYTRLQLWGAALPTNTPGVPCIFDPKGRAGICGDWLLGSNVEDAALSGIALANHIADFFESGGANPDDFAIGLETKFKPLIGHDIGQFPGLESEKQINESRALQTTIS